MQKLKLTTDQNVPIEVELASIGQRLLAVLLDVVILVSYFFIMMILIMIIFSTNFSIFDQHSYDFWVIFFSIMVYLPFVLYTPMMEYFTKGQTIGKMALGIRVTKVNGENAKFKDYFTRWLFRPYEMYIFMIAFGGIMALIASFFFDTLISSISSKNQRIGDFMANTVVVRKRPKKVYSIRDILAIRSNQNYTPQYLGVSMYTDEDMMLVKNVISRVEAYKNKATKELAIELADKIADDLKMEETPKKKLKFLKTILNHYEISNQLIAYHIHNEHKTVERIIDQIKAAGSAAIVSDAGTPSISDPGFLLVRACIENEINVVCLPGPSAIIPAIVGSGFPCDSFIFEGFLPQKKGRHTKWKTIADESRSVVLYESPHRLVKALKEMVEYLEPNRQVCVAREISKMYETFHRGTAEELLAYFEETPPKGEIVIVISAKTKEKKND